MTASGSRYLLNIEQIQKLLPHRQPFLLIDRVLEIEPKGDLDVVEPTPDKAGTRVVALKNISYNEPQFAGHFPSLAVFPGVLQVECMAQTACMTLYPYFEKKLERMKDFQCFLVGVDNARFRRPVVPGDQLRIETVVEKAKARLWLFKCKITVDGQKVAEADIMANLAVRSDQ